MAQHRDFLKPAQGNGANVESRSRWGALRSALVDRRDVLKAAGGALMSASGMSKFASAGMVNQQTADQISSAANAKDDETFIFPNPRQLEVLGGDFPFNEDTRILVPANASASDFLLSRFLSAELSDRYDLQVTTQRTTLLAADGPVVLMGTDRNPLIRECCAREGIHLLAENPRPDEYTLRVGKQVLMIAGRSDRGAFYGLQSLRQMIRKGDNGLRVRAVSIHDWSDKLFRGVKLYLPGRINIPFFKRFLRDFVALYKFNTVIMEMNACTRLDRHPELNAGWIEFARDTNYSRRNYPPGPLHDREQNSSHHDCCDGGFLEKEEVADLVRWAAENHIEVVPEIPSLTHSYYLLTRHKDLSDVPGDKWPDTYCPSNPKSYDLLFDVMDEYIEVMKPKLVHAGHDEWFAPFGLCSRCRGKDPGELYGQDLTKIHDYLANRGIKMAIWGDYLVERVAGRGLQKRVSPDGWTYYSPGAMTPQQVRDLVPKDILIFNWFWQEEEHGELNEAQLDDFGFRQVYGNMEAEIQGYPERSKRSTLIGGGPSSWEATAEFNIGKDLVYNSLGCSSLLWSQRALTGEQLSSITQALVPEIRSRLSGETPPSEAGNRVVAVDISASFNMPSEEPTFSLDLRGIETGRVSSGTKVFDLGDPELRGSKTSIIVGTEGQQPNRLPLAVAGIRVGQDATSLIFLHACAKPATNKEAFRLIWDFVDSADLLGWYEVVYEDGLVEVIPIRYGVNILECDWGRNQPSGKYCYGADLVDCGRNQRGRITFFAFEWLSPRLGKVIQEVRLRGSSHFRGASAGFENAFGAEIPSNAVILKALSVVPRKA
jgi:hypothetical protein